MNTKRTILLLGTLFLLSIAGYSQMTIKTTDGREIKVDVARDQIESIQFGSYSPTGVVTPPAPAKPSFIFFDDFNNGLDNWQGEATNKDIEDGVARFASQNHTGFETINKYPCENVVVEFRGAAHSNGFHGYIGSYGFNLGGWNNSGSGYAGPGVPFTKVASGKVYTPGQFHIWKLVRSGDTWAAYVDGREIFNKKISGESLDGRIRFTSYYSDLQIDWIKVYKQ